MAWELKTTPVSLPATKELAREFAEMSPAPHDRPLSRRRLEVYHKLLESRQFRPVTWAKAWCLETQDWYRVNGKHTSTLLNEVKVIPKGFSVIIESYECDTLEDVARLYGTFDSKMQSRTAQDIYISFAHVSPELRDMRGRFITSLVAGIGYHTWGEDYTKKQPAERAELLMDYLPFCSWAWGLLEVDSQETRNMSRQGVMAAMLQTFLKSAVKSTEFWTAVRDETGSSPDCPDRVLSKWLSQAKVKGRSPTRSGMTVTTREMVARCIHGWNAWRRGERTNLRYYADKEVPSAI